jgi:hypothetical protein
MDSSVVEHMLGRGGKQISPPDSNPSFAKRKVGIPYGFDNKVGEN